MIMFSVVIPLYNKERHIERAIRSVLAQTYCEFELIIVDDGSTDSGVSIASRVDDPRLRIIEQNNHGVSAARNRGIDAALNSYIAFLDADDEWKPDFLECISRLITEFPSAGAYATSYEISKNGFTSRPVLSSKIDEGWEGLLDDYFKFSLQDPLISASSVVVPARVFKRLGGFALGVSNGEDLDMWCKIAMEYKVAYCNIVGAIYFLDADNRACNSIPKLSSSFANYAEERLEKVKGSGNSSLFFEEYIIKILLTRKVKYLIFENKNREARELLRKYGSTKYSKKVLLKMYVLSLMPNRISRVTLNAYKNLRKKLTFPR